MISKMNRGLANAKNEYACEFKSEVIKQVIYKGHAVIDVASGLKYPQALFTIRSTSQTVRSATVK
jgi:hypothetical protein